MQVQATACLGGKPSQHPFLSQAPQSLCPSRPPPLPPPLLRVAAHASSADPTLPPTGSPHLCEAQLLERLAAHDQGGVLGDGVADGLSHKGHGAAGAGVGLNDVGDVVLCVWVWVWGCGCGGAM